MCVGIPGKVVAIVDAEHGVARADVNGTHRDISLGVLQDEQVAVGDWVVIHMGFALAKIDAQEAADTYAFLDELGRVDL